MAAAADADQINADPRRHLAIDAPPPPLVPKDMHGSENLVPLSPQWLHPRNGDNKIGISAGDSHFSIQPGSRPDAVKVTGNGEDFRDTARNKDDLIPSLPDSESGRHNRWRDEERETNSAIRRDHWRGEVDKEVADVRRTERWVDSSPRYPADARRAPSDRWTDSVGRETNHEQRRESKWNTRWGPDDKESENRREKWSDYGRDEGSRDKGTPQLISQGKDMNNLGKEDREGDNYSRSWRSNSFLARGRGETLHNQSPTVNKPPPVFAYGRGRGENGGPFFPAGRARFSSGTSTVNTSVSRSSSLGAVSEKSDVVHGDPSSIRYSRMKLLDIYRTTDLKGYRLSLDGFEDVPSLTVAEPSEPLALSAPTSEELVILKGIDKGDIVSSLPLVAKDGSVGKNASESAIPKHTKLGTREDQTSFASDYKGDVDTNRGDRFISLESHQMHERYSHPHEFETRAAHNQGFHPYQENSLAPKAFRPEGFRLQRDSDIERNSNSPVAPSYYRDESYLQSSGGSYPELKFDSRIERQTSGVLDQQRECNIMYGQNEHFTTRENHFPRKLQPYTAPEDLSLYYKDPNGQIQGPFPGSDLIGWFESAYFGIDLQVRLANAPPDAPFSSLGDVMPHLRTKARPPPGFAAAKQNEVVEMPIKGNFGGPTALGNINSSVSDFEHVKNGNKHRQEVGTEAENRFIESLMSGNMRNSPSERYSFLEGMQGYNGGGLGGMPLAGVEGGGDMNYLLAQRLALERHRSLPNSVPYWPGIDPSCMGSKPEIIPQSPLPHSFVPSLGDPSRQGPPPSQNVDLLSILQAAAIRPPPPPNSTGPVWSNFPDARPVNNNIYGSMDLTKDKVDMLRDQNITPHTGFGAQRMPPQNQPPLSQIMTQPGDISSGLIAPENLLSSEIAKDPQMLNLLQQQYLLSQLQLQTQAPVSNQLSLLDKILLKQQLEQQQQQLLLKQQQHLRSQILSVQQSHQHFGEPSYGHTTPTMPTGNAPVDNIGLQKLNEALQINHQMGNINLYDGRTLNHPNIGMHPQVGLYKFSSASSLMPLPHEMFDHTDHSKELSDAVPQPVGSIQNSDSMEDRPLEHEALENSAHNVLVPEKKTVDNCAVQPKKSVVAQTNEAVDNATFLEGTRTDFVSKIPGQVDAPKFSSGIMHEDEPLGKTGNDTELLEVKKSSEKKPRKQKKSKAQAAPDLDKVSTKAVVPIQQTKVDSQTEVLDELYTDPHGLHNAASSMRIGGDEFSRSAVKRIGSQQANMATSEIETVQWPSEQHEFGKSESESQSATTHRAWKPAPGLKAKSLVEIQQEEQLRAQIEKVTAEVAAVVIPTSISSTPWNNLVASENKSAKDTVQGLGSAPSAMGNVETSSFSKSRKSQLHDLLAEEVLAKSNEEIFSDDKGSFPPPMSHVSAQDDISAFEYDDFVEAKDTKKGRKKAAKVKGAGQKASSPVASADFPPPVSTEKPKNTRQLQQEKELLPAPSAGPLLGDFVFWKGEQANAVPAPAWSVDSGKLQKPTLLRDILREQGRKNPSVQQHIPIPPAKVPVTSGSRGSVSRQVPGSSPSKATSPGKAKAVPMQTSSFTAPPPKSKIDDDLFWGPLDQSKPETKQSEFPSLGNPSGKSSKGITGKGAPGGASNRQKSSGSRSSEYALSSSPSAGQSLTKGKRDATSRLSEAMDFRDWCEVEMLRLTGSNDTSFLEYCLKQSTAEAGMLLRENIGSMDRNHEFTDKFLNYKDFLSSDVIEIAFQPQNRRKGGGDILRSAGGDTGAVRDADGDAGGGGGKKKGKKGKKMVNPAVLGFNVVSNRIMMGEIQSVED